MQPDLPADRTAFVFSDPDGKRWPRLRMTLLLLGIGAFLSAVVFVQTLFVTPELRLPFTLHQLKGQLKALQKKAAADSIRKQTLLQKQQDSLKKAAADKAKEKDDDKKPDPKPETKPAPKEDKPAPVPDTPKRESPATAVNSDEYLYKAAMVYQQQGNLSEAIDRYKRIESVSSGKYVEMARYQLAICYRSKGQMGKARRMFKEVVRMDGSMKSAAQQALDSM